MKLFPGAAWFGKLWYGIPFLFMHFGPLYAQVGGVFYGNLIKEGETKIELWLFPPTTSCGSAAGVWIYKLRTENVDQLDTTKKYLTWKMNTISCDGFLVEMGFRVAIESILSKSSFLKGNNEWVFVANKVEGGPFDIKLSEKKRNVSSLVRGPRLYPVDSVVGKRVVTSDEPVELQAFGPAMPAGTEWVWYKDSCGGKPIHQGPTLHALPGASTNYYIRSARMGFTSFCTRIAIEVNDSSTAAHTIASKNGVATICTGSTEPVALSLVGGRLGYKASWVWYANGIEPGNRIAAGSTMLYVNPDRSTTYFVRAEGPLGHSPPVSFALKVLERSAPPLEIKPEPAGAICQGEYVRLSVVGGKLGDGAKWVWGSTANDGSKRLLGNGAFIYAVLNQSTVFHVYGEGYCGHTKEIYYTATAKLKSVNPLSSSITSQLIRRGKDVRTVLQGGVLGDGAGWVWYSDSAGTRLRAKGQVVLSKSWSDSLLYLRAEGDCNITELIRYKVPVKPRATYVFFNAGWITNTFRLDSSNLSNFFITVGTQRLYAKAGLGWPELAGNEGGQISSPVWDTKGTVLQNYPLSNEDKYLFNGKVYPRVQLFTAGGMLFHRKNGKPYLTMFLGGGWGSYTLFRQFKVYNGTYGTLKTLTWAKDIDRSMSGPAGEAGLFLKVKRINFMGGVNVIYAPSRQQSFASGFFGAGFTW